MKKTYFYCFISYTILLISECLTVVHRILLHVLWEHCATEIQCRSGCMLLGQSDIADTFDRNIYWIRLAVDKRLPLIPVAVFRTLTICCTQQL